MGEKGMKFVDLSDLQMVVVGEDGKEKAVDVDVALTPREEESTKE